ncbi:MAG: TerB family tellurite resistance protein [Deltaproteobacteria bacterium]|nr:TerB family tellurite resistance protein [Deltaproteobacteria bacterium]
MLDDSKKKLLKLLVALAWADGRVDEEEMEIVEAMLDTFGADKETGDEIREWAKTHRSLDEIDISDLTEEDAGLVLYQAVLLTYIDGEQSEKEVELINQFMAKLGLSKEDAAPILERATTRAKELLPMLQD